MFAPLSHDADFTPYRGAGWIAAKRGRGLVEDAQHYQGWLAIRVRKHVLSFRGIIEYAMRKEPSNQTKGLVARLEEFKRVCWDIEWQSPQYKGNIANWERIYFTRKISIWMTYCIRNTPITPNQVTAVWVFLGIVGAALLALGNYWISLLALCILCLSWVLDNVDGELARYKQQFSSRGSLLDMLGHDIFFSLIFFALTISMWIKGYGALFVVLGGLATALVTPLTKMQEHVKLLLCLKILSRKDRFDNSQQHVSHDHVEEQGGVGFTSLVTNAVGFIFTQTGMFYGLILAVVLDRVYIYVAFYGFCIPLVLFPKYLTRAKELDRLAGDPQALNHFIRPEWLE